MAAVLSIISGILGCFSLLFLAPFSFLTGFQEQAVWFALLGILLVGISRWLGFSRIGIEIMAIVCISLLAVIYLITLPQVRALPKDAGIKYKNVITLSDAVDNCIQSGLEGWELVTYAHNLTAGKMCMDRFNPWDSPVSAFVRGGGQDFQRTLALKEILDQIGISNTLVYSRLDFSADDPERENSIPIFGHIWIRVRMGDEIRDVSPPRAEYSSKDCFFVTQPSTRVFSSSMKPLVQLWWVIRGLDFEITAGGWNPVSKSDKI